jgi:CO/xanthine dehydrogenase Mo-binding subunit
VVAVVRDGDYVGVVAEREEQARAAVLALEAEWTPGDETGPTRDLDLRSDAGVDASLAGAAARLEAEYSVPHVSNAPIGPSAAVADVRADGTTLYASTQRPFGLREEAARLLGLPVEKVRVVPQMSSGSYGRNNVTDASLEAVRLSRAVGRPVLLQWTRAQEFQAATNRPYLMVRAQAGLDADGNIAVWRYDVRTNLHTPAPIDALPPPMLAATSGGNALPPYRIGSAHIALHIEPGLARSGAFRSLAGAPNVFAAESLIDELAHLAGADPVAFRLRHLTDPRIARVLELVAERARWKERRPSGRGRGVACAEFHGTRIAQVAEVAVEPSGRVRLERVWCAVDPGAIVNPDGARNQIEGGVVQAASNALFEELRVRDGRVTTSGWDAYPIATFRDAPQEIDVLLAPSGAPASGLGEPGLVPTAAAIANAVFDAVGARVRDLPLRADRVRAARPAAPPSRA